MMLSSRQEQLRLPCVRQRPVLRLGACHAMLCEYPGDRPLSLLLRYMLVL